jgi:putative tricarboxylic transport membrane protein
MAVNKTFDRYASLVFLLIGVLFMEESTRISQTAYGSNVGPNVFPFGLGLIFALLSLRLFYETFRYPKVEKTKQSLDYRRFLIILVAAILYAYFLEDIGYIIGTFLFLLIGFQTMQRGKWLASIVIAALFSYGVYYVYVNVLKGTLPGWPVWFGM